MTSEYPLRGKAICCTSVASELRSEIAQIAEQLGAVHHYDLRNDVTHLIVGSIDTAKYKYVARERPDVQVLLPSFIIACRDHWREGHDQSPAQVADAVARLEDAHRVPVFHGLRISVTGFEDLAVRQSINRAVRDHGAIYAGDLTREVTHLIAKEPRGKKYEFAVQWGIKVVALEWLEDSLKRGLVLEEHLYDPRTPPEERGVGAVLVASLPSPAPVDGASAADGCANGATDHEAGGTKRRRIRRTASRRLEGGGELWAEITARGPEAEKQSEWGGDALDAPDQPDPADVNEELQFTAEPTLEADVSSRSGGRPAKAKPQGIFRGSAVFVWGFERKKEGILRQFLESNDAKVLALADLTSIPSTALSSGFLVVPHERPFSTDPTLLHASLTSLSLPAAYHAPASRMSMVTEHWVEQCLHSKTLIDIPLPSSHAPKSTVLLRPFPAVGPAAVTGWSGRRICTTGIHDIQLLHISRVLALMGAVFVEDLTKDVDVLVSAAPDPDAATRAPLPQSRKIDFALREEIPVVDVEWLYDSLTRGAAQDLRRYSIYEAGEDGGKGDESSDDEDHLSRARRPKGAEPEWVPTNALSALYPSGREGQAAGATIGPRTETAEDQPPNVEHETEPPIPEDTDAVPQRPSSQPRETAAPKPSTTRPAPHLDPTALLSEFAAPASAPASAPDDPPSPPSHTDDAPPPPSAPEPSRPASSTFANALSTSIELLSNRPVRPRPADADQPAPVPGPRKRKRSPLGRAASSRSVATSRQGSEAPSTRGRPLTSGVSGPEDADSNPGDRAADDVDDAGSGADDAPTDSRPPRFQTSKSSVSVDSAATGFLPSQHLIYEDPEQQRSREMLLRRMNGGEEPVEAETTGRRTRSGRGGAAMGTGTGTGTGTPIKVEKGVEEPRTGTRRRRKRVEGF